MATTSLWHTAPRGLFQYEITGAPRVAESRVIRRWVLSNRIGGCLTRRFFGCEGLASTPSHVSGDVPSPDSARPSHPCPTVSAPADRTSPACWCLSHDW